MRTTYQAGLAVIVALLVPNICLWLSGADGSAWMVLWSSTLGSLTGFLDVLVYAIPLCLIGSGLYVSFRAGIINIGGDGQLIAGAISAVALAPWAAQLGHAGLVVFLLVGFLGGGALGAFTGWLRSRFSANEIIVTIMMNYVAVQALAWSIRGPLQESTKVFPRSDQIDPVLQLAVLIPGSRVHSGMLLALGVAVLTYVLFRTRFGFQLAVLGDNPSAASYAGFPLGRLTVWAMLISGGCAGLAGAVEIAALHHRLYDNFAQGYGLAAIAVALMAGRSPLLIPVTAIVFGVFLAGAGALQRQLNVPFPIAWVIEGAVVLALLATRASRVRA
jgi:general nucleoside transport system permease protein